jgi:hypothetical protein
MRNKLFTLFSLSFSEIYTVFCAIISLCAAEFQIRLSPSEDLLKKLQSPVPARLSWFLQPLRKLRLTRIVSLVEAADRNCFGKAHCLRRTLTLSYLTSRLGFYPELKIGVCKDGDSLRAHSWLEIDSLKLEMEGLDFSYSSLAPTSKNS